MPQTFIYRCPNMGLNVQGWLAEDPEENGHSYTPITCLACGKVHLVNPRTGKTLGERD